MSFPAPTVKQARLLWLAATAVAVAVLLGAAVLGLWALGWVLNRLVAILVPLAVAGVLAYLLEPVVGFFERRGLSRPRAIVWVFILAGVGVLLLLATVLPRLVVEITLFVHRGPEYAEQVRQAVQTWLAESPLGLRAQQWWDSETGDQVRDWLQQSLPVAGQWLWARVGNLLAGFGLVLGLAFVPFYLFYFLLHREAIAQRWTAWLPVRESRVKDEIIFVIRAINDALIVFFRGQVLVALCVGGLLTIGFALLGLNYAFLLGALAGVLGIIPYLGAAISLVPALALAGIQFRDWWHPLLVVAIFALVQLIEGAFLSPRIIGQRVGMHPVAVIVAVLVGTSLLGGIVGGILAIPLAAALRAVLQRYVWKS